MSKHQRTIVCVYRVFFFWLFFLYYFSDCLYYSYVTLQYALLCNAVYSWRILDACLNRRLVIKQGTHLKRGELDRAVHIRSSSAQKYSERNLQSLKVTGFHRPWNSSRSFRFQRNELGIAGEDRKATVYLRTRETEKYTMPFAITFYQLSN